MSNGQLVVLERLLGGTLDQSNWRNWAGLATIVSVKMVPK